jgi:hypothetical protein
MGEAENSEESEDDDFIQEEYDLQLQIEQIHTRLETFDEFSYFGDKVKQALLAQDTTGPLACLRKVV